MARNHRCLQGIGAVFLMGAVLATSPAARAVEFAGGTGEPNDPYLIATAEQLRGADFDVPGTYFRLAGNIDLDRKSFRVDSFRAHLDGAGFEIQNGVIASTSRSFIGLLEREGMIANLTLADFDMGWAVRPDRPGDPGLVGGLVMINRGIISNCGAIGWIATRRVAFVGGLVGQNEGSIINCYFDGWISTDWEVRTDEDEYASPRAGGLAATNFGSIVSSLARGVVVGRMGLGGLVGSNAGTINDCYSTCMVIGDVGSGGLVSDNWGSLRNCYASGWVMGQMRGGLVGTAGLYAGSVTNCLWDTLGTGCLRSGAGIGVHDGPYWTDLALNGWDGDPNWVIVRSFGDPDVYPRLAWEGAPGEIVAEYPFSIFRQGSGTQGDPYVIETVGELESMSRASVYWDKHFVLVADLNAASLSDFSPIGVCSGSSFSGTFDGQGHVIRNLRAEGTMHDGEATAWNLGLFGYVTGQIRNLTVENAYLASGPNSRWVGMLAGTCEGVIENCHATGSMAVGQGSQYIGGLVGYVAYKGGQVVDCSAEATIEAGEGSTDVGPLIGYQEPNPRPR